jgi:hypothetical protein
MESRHQQNGWLVRQTAEVLRRPIAASITDDFRSLADSGDDLNLYPKGIEVAASGISGCLTTYHTMKDDAQSLDARSVQDLGNSTLALARHLGILDLKHSSLGKATYFTFFDRLLFYPVTWVLPLTLFILVILVSILFLGFRRERFSARRLAFSFLLWLAPCWLMVDSQLFSGGPCRRCTS